MTGLRYLTDPDGKPSAVVVPIDLWRKLLPRENGSFDDLNEAIEDHCLSKAMDEGRDTPLLSRQEALDLLEE